MLLLVISWTCSLIWPFAAMFCSAAALFRFATVTAFWLFSAAMTCADAADCCSTLRLVFDWMLAIVCALVLLTAASAAVAWVAICWVVRVVFDDNWPRYVCRAVCCCWTASVVASCLS